MTIQEYSKKYLCEYGLSESQIDAIWNLAKQENELLLEIENKIAETYSNIILFKVIRDIEISTLKWLRKNKPQHFVIPIFENKVEGKPLPY